MTNVMCSIELCANASRTKRSVSIVGTWKLHTVVHQTMKGKKSYPMGKNPSGLLVYTPRGHMSVTIAAEKRKKFRKPYIDGGTMKQKADAIASFVSYAGKYHVEGHEIVHKIQICLFPDWVGGEVRRFMQMKGNTLVLTVPPFVQKGKEHIAQLVWKRVEL